VKPFIETLYEIRDSSLDPGQTTDRKATLVVVPRKEDIPLAKSLFSKMFSKLGLDAEQEAGFIALEGITYPFKKLVDVYEFKKLILCGIQTSELSIHSDLPFHAPVHMGMVYLLRTDTPARLEAGSMEFKSAFWQAFRTGYPTSQ
jgi:hypothetical protein